MYVLGLRAEEFRNLRRFEIFPSPGLNLLFGPNASGKTSILEALFLLGHARSFRVSNIRQVVRRGARVLRVTAELETERRGKLSLGVERGPGVNRVRCNGADLRRTTEQARLVQLCLVTPDSHALIEGSAQCRRRWLDWGMFHVEPGYLESWRRYYAALRQRNCLLRTTTTAGPFSPWEKKMQEAAVQLCAGREEYLRQLLEGVQELSREFLFVPLRFRIFHGWDKQRPLAEVLEEERHLDREAGFTRNGPHRLDLIPCNLQGDPSPQFSRGQQKMLALTLNMAQAQVFLNKTGEKPVFLIDDLASELDSQATARVLARLEQTQAQVFISATHREQVSVEGGRDPATFHVEQGTLRQVQ